MKVCIAISTIDKTAGGPSRSVPLLAKGLVKCGVDVTIVTIATSSMNLGVLENSGVKLKILKSLSYSSLKIFIESERFDIIHSQNLWEPFYHYISIIAQKTGIPYIMTPRGTLEPWSLSQKKYKKKLALALYQKRDLNKSSCILATATMEAENIRKVGINSPIAVIPNGLDVKEYDCRKISSCERVKKQILFLSRIHKKKGIELLIEAWSVLANNYKDWQVIIAGNGEQEYITELNNIIHNAGLQTSVKIEGPVFGKDKIKLYQESALFVLPSYSENFGMVIAEAMACGLPVITTKSTPWGVLNEKSLGWCIELSKDSLVEAINMALSLGQTKLFNMGSKASEYISSTLQYEKVAELNKSVYEWILGKKIKPTYINQRFI